MPHAYQVLVGSLSSVLRQKHGNDTATRAVYTMALSTTYRIFRPLFHTVYALYICIITPFRVYLSLLTRHTIPIANLSSKTHLAYATRQKLLFLCEISCFICRYQKLVVTLPQISKGTAQSPMLITNNDILHTSTPMYIVGGYLQPTFCTTAQTATPMYSTKLCAV